ncbi:MAG: hypothetical protein QM726_11070 [Chitinophagaceae bacterium]
MKRAFLTLKLLSISLIFLGQSQREFVFKDIGLHIKISSNYLICDKFSKAPSDRVQEVLTVSTPDSNNSVSIKIGKRISGTFDFEQCYSAFKDEQLLIAKQYMTAYDTVSSFLRVDYIDVRKFSVRSTNSNLYSGVYLASVKNYFLVIQIDSVDKEFEDDIESSIVTSKFN